MSSDDRPTKPTMKAAAANERMRLTEEKLRGTRISKLEGDFDDFKVAVQGRDSEVGELLGDLCVASGLIARELGVEEQLPERLRRSVPAASDDAPPTTKPLLPALGRDARRSRVALYIATALTILQVVREAFHLLGGSH